MVSVSQTRNPQSFERLAIQFSETDPAKEPLAERRIRNSASSERCSLSGLDEKSSRECAYKGYCSGCQRRSNIFRLPVPTTRSCRYFLASKWSIARWFRPINPVTLRELPCSNALATAASSKRWLLEEWR